MGKDQPYPQKEARITQNFTIKPGPLSEIRPSTGVNSTPNDLESFSKWWAVLDSNQ